MPESRRRKPRKTEPAAPAQRPRAAAPSPPWFGGLILALFVVGIVWLVLFYVTGGILGLEHLKNWNVLVGFGFIVVGLGVATQWR